MKRYEFRAVRTGKQEVIIGLAFPAMIMLPILAIQLVLFYSGLDKVLKSNSSVLLRFGFIFFVIVIVYASFYFIRKLQESLIKNYIVELDATNIKILENGKEIISGSVSDCKVINKINRNPTNVVFITIYTDVGKISFRLRGKNWRSITGNSEPNPVGTSNINDMETALALVKDIKAMNL